MSFSFLGFRNGNIGFLGQLTRVFQYKLPLGLWASIKKLLRAFYHGNYLYRSLESLQSNPNERSRPFRGGDELTGQMLHINIRIFCRVSFCFNEISPPLSLSLGFFFNKGNGKGGILCVLEKGHHPHGKCLCRKSNGICSTLTQRWTAIHRRIFLFLRYDRL